MRHDDLTLATTVHNNTRMCFEMLRSFETSIGQVSEIIVADDHSEVPVALPEFSSPVRLIRTEKPLGFCKASDLALRAVRTKYALLVDADVLFQPGDFAGGFSEFRQGSWAWVNFGQVSFQGKPQASYEEPLMPPWVFAAGNQVYSLWQSFHRAPAPQKRSERLAPVEAAHSSCTLVRMEAFQAVGGFDPWYWQCQSDVDLSLRLRQKGYGVGVDLGYEVRHEGAGGKGGGTARVLDLYRSRVHLYENAYPASRFYLRPLLFLRHLAEVIWFGVVRLFRKDDRFATRLEMLKGALHGYE
jgi:N-acetylglucosaminyl-diphospho-decaprenol L-rhamnosyltransferase